jgi:hypothetical protein
MDSKTKIYAVGTLKALDAAFPNYPGNDVRKSLDGKQAIYEANVSPDELAKLKKDPALKMYSQQEILAVIHSPKSEGIWYPKITDSKHSPDQTNEP